MSILERISAYAHSDDPITAACNRIALLIASNQPFYPLYVWWIAGEGAAVTLLTWISTPFFLLVPALARNSNLAGRVLLVAAGSANTFMCMKAFGNDTAVALFLIPCALLAILSFRKREAAVILALLGIIASGFMLLRAAGGPPLHSFSQSEASALASLHAYSVAALSILILWTFRFVFRKPVRG